MAAEGTNAFAAAAHSITEAAELCGTRFASIEGLIRQLQADDRFREAPGPEMAAGEQPFSMFTRAQGDVGEEWLIAGEGHRVYPAVSCGRYVAAGNHSSHSRTTHCRADAAACGEFDRFLEQRDLQPRLAR